MASVLKDLLSQPMAFCGSQYSFCLGAVYCDLCSAVQGSVDNKGGGGHVCTWSHVEC